MGRVLKTRGGFLNLERDLEGPGEAWRGSLSVILGVASCSVGGLQLDDRSSQIQTWVVAGLLAWFVLAAVFSRPDSCDQLIDYGGLLVLLVRFFVAMEKPRGAWRGLDRGVERPEEAWRGLEREREST